ncbi:T9SS type A sorting domain-containing protein [Polaribacter aestuariivivens]|uniref:T9SS type A sorting domain-containing protein n=1 Tax=Polaribacter aestuariivivens TaxID=2304626 RepID=UPI003F4928C7
MKKNYLFTLFLTFCFSILSFGQDLIITGAFDGPNTGGTPKGIELYVVNNIADLSIYGVGSANNGGGTDGEEFTFPADAVTAGTFIYVATENVQFNAFFGIDATYTDGSMGINGDDAVELFKNGTVVDTFGDIAKDGTGEAWDHVDGWAYRKNGTGPDGGFVLANWTFSGTNQLEGGSTNNATNSPFPIGTYSVVASTTPSLSISSPSAGALSNTTSVSVSISVDNFNLSADNGSGMSDNSGDGYIKSTFETQGGSTESSSFFTTSLPDITVAPGNTYTLTLELVDNSGASLSSPISDTVTFNIEYPCDIQLDSFTTTCNAETTGVDTYSVSIPYTMGGTSTYTLTTDSGTIGGDDPSTTATGTITISDIAEGTDIVFNLKGDPSNSNCDITRNISSPTCLPAPTCPVVGSLVITEIMQNPSSVSDDNGEYFEVYNTTNAPIELQGWVIGTASSGAPVTDVVATSLIVPANGYVVFGENADTTTNGGVTVDYQYDSSLFLGNGNATISLTCGSDIIDQVNYDGGTEFPDPNGKSMELATNKYSATDNDTGANWAEATSEIVSDGDLGTPGAANDFVLSVDRNDILGFATYPNPITNNEFTITSNNSSKKEIVLFNVLGKKVLSTSFTGTKSTVDVSTINSGIYILKVTEKGKTATKKVVIR